MARLTAGDLLARADRYAQLAETAHRSGDGAAADLAIVLMHAMDQAAALSGSVTEPPREGTERS